MLDNRFWSKVAVTSADACWHWTANKNNKGYGLFRPGGLKPKRLAHRLSYADRNGPIPDGMCVLHKCDTPSCVNPSHLFLGTMKDNTRDMIAKGRKVVGYNPNNKPPHFIGSAHPQAKLTEELVRLYRARLAAGEPLRPMAREIGIDAQTLRAVRDRKSWIHVL